MILVEKCKVVKQTDTDENGTPTCHGFEFAIRGLIDPLLDKLRKRKEFQFSLVLFYVSIQEIGTIFFILEVFS